MACMSRTAVSEMASENALHCGLVAAWFACDGWLNWTHQPVVVCNNTEDGDWMFVEPWTSRRPVEVGLRVMP
jgi:hypothetical protein